MDKSYYQRRIQRDPSFRLKNALSARQAYYSLCPEERYIHRKLGEFLGLKKVINNNKFYNNMFESEEEILIYKYLCLHLSLKDPDKLAKRKMAIQRQIDKQRAEAGHVKQFTIIKNCSQCSKEFLCATKTNHLCSKECRYKYSYKKHYAAILRYRKKYKDDGRAAAYQRAYRKNPINKHKKLQSDAVWKAKNKDKCKIYRSKTYKKYQFTKPWRNWKKDYRRAWLRIKLNPTSHKRRCVAKMRRRYSSKYGEFAEAKKISNEIKKLIGPQIKPTGPEMENK